MFKIVDDELVEMTPEEIEEFQKVSSDYVAPTPIVSEFDRIEAQVIYTALMTDTILEG